MVHVEGQATTGYAGSGTAAHVPLPQPTMARVAHRPWCVDCKRKHEAADLDDAQRCAKCAHAAVTRAEAAARRAERADEIASLEQAARADVIAAARKRGETVVRRGASPSTQVAKREAARPTSAAEKPSTGTPAGHAPRQDPVEAPGAARHRLDSECARATQILVDSRADTSATVRALRRAVLASLDALQLVLNEHQTPATAATSTPAAAGPADSTAPSPAVEPATTTSAGHREGEARARLATTRKLPSKFDPHRDDIVRRYTAGESARSIADTLPFPASNEGLCSFLRREGVTIRPRGGSRKTTSTTNPTGDTAA